MFAYYYQVCVAVFLIQGVSLPFLVILSGIVWWMHGRRLERLRGEFESATGKKAKASGGPEFFLDSLPKLKPLKCQSCGGNVLLDATRTRCAYCDMRGELPDDYAAAGRLRHEVKRLLKSAVRHWTAAKVLTFRPVGWLFFLLIFFEPFVLFPTVVAGSSLYRDTWADKVLEGMGERWGFVVMLAAFLGFIIWLIVFIFLANLNKSLRRRLPVVPVFEERVRATEAASCESCGGGIEYDAGDFACICAYCNVGNFRVKFTRVERGRAEAQKTEVKSVLFGAMSILDEFVGTFFFALFFLVTASVLLVVFYAIRNLF